MVKCPYKNCTFESSVYSTFNAHKSEEYRLPSQKHLKPDIVLHSSPHDSDPDLSQDVQEDEALDNDPTDFCQEENEEVEFLKSPVVAWKSPIFTSWYKHSFSADYEQQGMS